MISRTAFCSAQAARMLAARPADTFDLSQTVGGRLDDVEDLLAERAHEPLGPDRTDATDHAG